MDTPQPPPPRAQLSAAASQETGPSTARLTAWAFVCGQFVLLAVIVLLPSGRDWTVPRALALAASAGSWVGIAIMVVAALGLGRGLTASPLPNDRAQLRTAGLYGLVRHPIYSGLLLFSLAQVASSGRLLVALAGLLLTVLINAKARWEERRLGERFEGYREYAQHTARFVPALRYPRRGGTA
jgi:protein-S-isoprenylcysteine O-methyltransferase Ste14